MKHDSPQGYVGHHQHEQQLNSNLPDPDRGGHNRHSSHEHAMHDKHAGHSPAMFQQRFFICLLLTVPVLYLSPMFQMWFNYQAIQFAGVAWVTPILATIIYWYGGWVFLRGAWTELHSKIGMMTLVALAITVSYIYSVAVSFGLADRVRPSARAAVAKLQQMGVQVVMITGDAEAVAKTVAEDLKIDRYYARVLPQDKAALIHRLKAEQPIAFVGDGINDAPALTEADLGLAIGAGTNVAIESADLVLVKSDPLDATYALKLAKATYAVGQVGCQIHQEHYSR